MTDPAVLPSWRPGATRDAVLAFLEALQEVAPEERLACFDNDGTLWCERPSYVQLDFFLSALRARATEDPALRHVPELAALLDGEQSRVRELGLPRVALALTELFDGAAPEDFAAEVRDFLAGARHPGLGRRHRDNRYLPMLELVAELRRRDVTVAVVTGGGADFVRAVSRELYGVPPEAVVGTQLAYDVAVDDHGEPAVRRTGRLLGGANEGATKLANIQSQLGRRPVLAAGNSAGDREMLQWSATGPGPSLALLVDHDDPEREFAYRSTAESFADTEPITDVAARLGWTVISMARDWETVFGPVDPV